MATATATSDDVVVPLLDCFFGQQASPSEVSLSARVLKMGMTQLLDVVLHSRERLDVKAWEVLLQRALSTSPEMCRYVRMKLNACRRRCRGTARGREGRK